MKTKPTNNTGTLRRVLLTLGIGLLTGLPAFATATWINTAGGTWDGGDWMDSANWSGGTRGLTRRALSSITGRLHNSAPTRRILSARALRGR